MLWCVLSRAGSVLACAFACWLLYAEQISAATHVKPVHEELICSCRARVCARAGADWTETPLNVELQVKRLTTSSAIVGEEGASLLYDVHLPSDYGIRLPPPRNSGSSCRLRAAPLPTPFPGPVLALHLYEAGSTGFKCTPSSLRGQYRIFLRGKCKN